MPLRKGKKIACLVTLPNSLVHYVSLHEESTGYDGIEKICSILGIVETDYFGLRYIDHRGMYVWLNNRMKLSSQIKAQPPYQLHFRVKYFVDPKMLQQPSTRYVFFQEAKSLMLKGQLPVTSQEAGRIGGLLAQVDFGDSNNQMCYPRYFKEWTPGISREIAKHHASLKGIQANEAEKRLLNEVSKLENWGVSYLKVLNMEDNSLAFVGLGGCHIRLCNGQWRMIKKISYSSLLEASFRNRVFSISYRSLTAEGQVADKRLLLLCQNHRVSRYMFRLLTEDHTFFTHEVVNERVREHIRHTRWQLFRTRCFGSKRDPKYHFDVIRTQYEAYTRAWEQLHQVNQGDLNDALSARHSRAGSPSDQTHQTEVNSSSEAVLETESFPISPSSPTNNSDLFRFGLSSSCCDIAKQLLQETSVASQDHIENKQSEAFERKPSTSDEHNGSVCLTKEGTEKLEQFIQKIVDSKLCRICMDNPVSAVFCPCGHHMTCYQCASECSKCPMCRKQVAYVQYVYGNSS